MVNYKELNGLVSIDSDDDYLYAVDSKGLKIFDNKGKEIYNEENTIKISKDKFVKTLNKGWNLIGNPTLDNYKTSNIKSSLVNWSYDSGKWTMNPEEITSSTGFWVYSKNMEDIEFTGERELVDLNSINQGWTILSSGEDVNNPTANENVVISWIYEQGVWTHNPKVVKAGRGFWVLKK